jgi:3-phenylpropionate/trans-cinnamate dioxygenase ferredoxin reductase subunit
MTSVYDVLIVGAGHGGAQTAIALRKFGFAGTVAILSDELELPYERPPLSKAYLLNERSFERMLIRPQLFWSRHDIALLVGHHIVSVDSINKTVHCSRGTIWRYRQLVWSAGGKPRRLTCAGQGLLGVHTIRTRSDVDAIARELGAVRRVVIIGGGYIGLEAAAALTKLGKKVTVVEALDRVLARVTGEVLSRFIEREHRGQGVDVRLSATVDCVEGAGGRTVGVRLVGGEVVPAEMVIVGIGIIPAVDALLRAGGAGGNGVAVDRQCRTTLPDLFAIGDCALHTNPFASKAPVRLESVQNAADMASVVAKAIMGSTDPYHSVPWFWSEQYDLKLQTVGISAEHDAAVVRGNPLNRSFSVVYLRSGGVIALDCVNATKDYVQGRSLVLSNARVPEKRLSDTSLSLNELLVEEAVTPASN